MSILDSSQTMDLLTVYVPSTYAVDAKISQSDFSDRVSLVRHWLANRFGGATTPRSASIGDYIANDGSLVSENVMLVSTYVDPDTLANNAEDVLSFARELREAWAQESIMITVQRSNGTAVIFVDDDPVLDQVVTKGGE
jgi:hypothetical protein